MKRKFLSFFLLDEEMLRKKVCVYLQKISATLKNSSLVTANYPQKECIFSDVI